MQQLLYPSDQGIGCEEVLKRKDLLNYYKKLQRTFLREVVEKECKSDNSVACARNTVKGEEDVDKRDAKDFGQIIDGGIGESWSEGRVTELKRDDDKIHRQNSSVPSFYSKWKRFVRSCANSKLKRDSIDALVALNDRTDIVPPFFPIKADLNSLDILHCEELLKQEEERRDRGERFGVQHCGSDETFRETILRCEELNRVNDTSGSPCEGNSSTFRKDPRSLSYNERTNIFTSEQTVRSKNNAKHRGGCEKRGRGRLRMEEVDVKGEEGSCKQTNSLRSREGFDRAKGSDIEMEKSTGIDDSKRNSRKGGGGEAGEEEENRFRTSKENLYEYKHRGCCELVEKLRTIGGAAEEKTFRTIEEENCAGFPYGIANEADSAHNRRRTRRITKMESDGAFPVGKGVPFESYSSWKDCRSDANATKNRVRRRIGSSFLADAYRKGDSSPRKNSSTTCCCSKLDPSNMSNMSQYRQGSPLSSCLAKPVHFSKRKPIVRVAKPEDSYGKTNLSKLVIYPPRGENGPPLTLYKNVSSIKCAVRGNSTTGFRYDVTYVQKFSSSW